MCTKRLEGDTLGERLLSAIDRAGYNRHSLAKALDTSWHHVNLWCNGNVEPKAHRLKEMAEILDVNLNELLSVGATEDPGFPGWKAFLLTPDGASMTLEERRTLVVLVKSLGLRGCCEPSLTSYVLGLSAIRAMHYPPAE